MSQFRQNTPDLTLPPTRMERRAEAMLDYLLAIAIGAAFTFVLVTSLTA